MGCCSSSNNEIGIPIPKANLEQSSQINSKPQNKQQKKENNDHVQSKEQHVPILQNHQKKQRVDTLKSYHTPQRHQKQNTEDKNQKEYNIHLKEASIEQYGSPKNEIENNSNKQQIILNSSRNKNENDEQTGSHSKYSSINTWRKSTSRPKQSDRYQSDLVIITHSNPSQLLSKSIKINPFNIKKSPKRDQKQLSQKLQELINIYGK